MKRMDAEKKQEIVIYCILWTVAFALVPLVLLFRGFSTGASFSLSEMLEIWLGILPFLVLFLLHDLLAAPLWVEKDRPGRYLAVLIPLVAAFSVFIWLTRREPERIGPGAPSEMQALPPPPEGDFLSPGPPFEGEPPFDGGRPLPPPDRGLPMAPELMKFVLGLLVVGVNLGVKFYLKSVRGERKMQELRGENLSRQLEALRYQVNPHFLMNTLNNIHALVDIDPEQAKRSIQELSKLMRYVLYEGDRPTIPLAMELDFLRHYVSLMRIRYADSVRIETDFPDQDGGAGIPPMILASFVENAFKHGISYERPSFVRIAVRLEDGKVSFKCVNSVQPSREQKGSGVGLQNVRNRLDLLYGDRYTLHIDRSAEVFDVLLLLPADPGPKEGASR